MLPVTTDFLNKMVAPFRKVYGKLIIDYTDPEIDQSVDVAVNEEARVSYPKQVANGVAEPKHKWFSFDGSAVLDGTYRLMPSTEVASFTREVGWWGESLAGAGGSFSSPYPTLTATHIARPVQSLLVVGDSKRQEYPVDFTIKLYDSTDTLLHTETVTANSQVTWSEALVAPVLNVTKQVLEITKWSHESRQVKIVEIFTSISEEYELGDFGFIDLLEERELHQSSLPVGGVSSNEISASLLNLDRRFDPGNPTSPLRGLLKLNRRIRAWLGAEWQESQVWNDIATTEWGDL